MIANYKDNVFYFKTNHFTKDYDEKSLEFIGKGGFGVVFKCLSKKLNHLVALKVFIKSFK